MEKECLSNADLGVRITVEREGVLKKDSLVVLEPLNY